MSSHRSERAVMERKEAEWRAESDHRTLSAAATIQADRDRMAGVQQHHRKVSRAHAQLSRTLGGHGRKGRR